MLCTWTFQRGDQRLMLQREDDEASLKLVITGEEGSRTVPFNSLGALVTFQTNMEQFLVRTGWSLATFAPERRQYQERRLFPRINADRRRWWTDGQVDAVPRDLPKPNRRS